MRITKFLKVFMSSILLIEPAKTKSGSDSIWNTIKQSSLPFGLLQLAAFIKANNIKVDLIDLQVKKFSEAEFLERVLKLRPDFFGITANTVQIKPGLSIAKLLKQNFPNIKIVFGGIHATVMADEVLAEQFVDFVVRGEGEQTIVELLAGRAYSEINGLSYKINGQIIHNQPRELIADLNLLPTPAYELIDLKLYRPTLGNFKQLPSVSITTSRGCPGTCTFCFSGAMGKKIRFMSAQKIFNHIKFLHDKFGVRDINFYDDTFTVNRANVFELCKMLIEAKLGISWGCMSRLDCVSEEILEMMHEAGCHQIGYGIETTSKEILENIKKRVPPLERIKEIVETTKKIGIEVRAMFMLGNPGETEMTMEDSIKFAKSLNADIYLFNVTTPYPGTEMFGWADKNEYLITKNWDNYDLYHYVMRLPTVDNKTIEKYYKKAYRSCYLRPSFIIRRLRKINSWNLLKAHVQTFTYFLKS